MLKHVSLLILAITLPASALAQETFTREVVVSESGKPVEPWREESVCSKEKVCQTALVNKNTDEVARLGARWTSEFGLTGRGFEAARRESAPDKAARLNGERTLR